MGEGLVQNPQVRVLVVVSVLGAVDEVLDARVVRPAEFRDHDAIVFSWSRRRLGLRRHLRLISRLENVFVGNGVSSGSGLPHVGHVWVASVAINMDTRVVNRNARDSLTTGVESTSKYWVIALIMLVNDRPMAKRDAFAMATRKALTGWMFFNVSRYVTIL
jgi:hypothetical protein